MSIYNELFKILSHRDSDSLGNFKIVHHNLLKILDTYFHFYRQKWVLLFKYAYHHIRGTVRCILLYSEYKKSLFKASYVPVENSK